MLTRPPRAMGTRSPTCARAQAPADEGVAPRGRQAGRTARRRGDCSWPAGRAARGSTDMDNGRGGVAITSGPRGAPRRGHLRGCWFTSTSEHRSIITIIITIITPIIRPPYETSTPGSLQKRGASCPLSTAAAAESELFRREISRPGGAW